MKLLSAPTFMMVAVAGIGIYAAYRMTKATNETEPGGGAPSELGSTLGFSTNRYYRGRLRVKPNDGANLPPFWNSATREELIAAMQGLGFSNVKVYMTANELPPEWPASARAGASNDSRWFEGQWRLASAQVPRPADIDQLWIAKPPADAKYTVSGEGYPRDRYMLPAMDWHHFDETNMYSYGYENAVG